MAYGNFVLDKGYDAAAALTKFRFCKMTNAGKATPVTAITDYPLGVAQFEVLSTELTRGKGASVRLIGISEVEASGAINPGTVCTLELDGRVCALVGASGKRIVGICLDKGAVNAGDRVAMELISGAGLA